MQSRCSAYSADCKLQFAHNKYAVELIENVGNYSLDDVVNDVVV